MITIPSGKKEEIIPMEQEQDAIKCEESLEILKVLRMARPKSPSRATTEPVSATCFAPKKQGSPHLDSAARLSGPRAHKQELSHI